MAARERLICAGDELVDGGDGVRFTVEWRGAAEPAFAVRFRGRAYAYLNRCAHVPVEIDWQPGKFFDFTGLYLVCAVHGALYAPETGACLGGRCDGRGLRPLVLVERDGGVYLIESE
ncbi:MAG: Rieske 2Fe-2S domain-containing protein [Rhodocyclaceae bacterium]|nr:Rieske 2Fe-2S domain-containing protein [Rhodocyclaceae bacterium]